MTESYFQDGPEFTVAPASGVNFEMRGVTPTWYRAMAVCQHGWVVNEMYQPAGPPDEVAMRASLTRNHQLLIGCGETWNQQQASTAQTTLPASTGVQPGRTRVLPQTAQLLNGSVFIYTAMRLKTIVAAPVTVRVQFTVTGSVAAGASGTAHVWINGASAQAAALVDVGGKATADVSWSGDLPAFATIEAAYANTSTQPQDVTGGNVLATSTVALA